jgi:hypothetical protein
MLMENRENKEEIMKGGDVVSMLNEEKEKLIKMDE